MFGNAASSDLGVKPLLVYYGVLCLARGAILLNDPKKKEESLQQRHGLEIVNWRETLGDGIRSVLGLGVRATKGTFSELAEVCRNEHREHCFSTPSKSYIVVDHDLGAISFARDGSVLQLDDLVSRLMQTAMEYPGITGRPAQWFPTIITDRADGTHFALFSPSVVSRFQTLIDKDLVVVKPTLPGWPNLDIAVGAQVSLVFRPDSRLARPQRFPVFHYTMGAPSMTGILDFPNGDKLSEFFKLYLTSYILGMLARYFPFPLDGAAARSARRLRQAARAQRRGGDRVGLSQGVLTARARAPKRVGVNGAVESVFEQARQVAAEAETLLVDEGWHAPEPAVVEPDIVAGANDADVRREEARSAAVAVRVGGVHGPEAGLENLVPSTSVVRNSVMDDAP